jgi:hypothetical protein
MCLRSGPKAAKNFLNLETAEVGLTPGKEKKIRENGNGGDKKFSVLKDRLF